MRRLHLTIGFVLAIAGATAAEIWLKDDKLVEAVQKKVREIQPSREEKRFDEIGWAASIVEARAISQKTNRPLFLFTYNGNIDTGRC
ncbi:MAG: hypothetical protein ABI806_18550 [Candidatus Solibacter sp.]